MHNSIMAIDSGKHSTQGVIRLSSGNYKQVIFRTLVTNNSTGLDPIGKRGCFLFVHRTLAFILNPLLPQCFCQSIAISWK